jgi:osmoprotectant transport system permease protein
VNAAQGLLLLLWLALSYPATAARPELVVGSKAFAESHVLAEISALLLEQQGFDVRRQLGLGGTLVAYQALRAGDIDLYPEYSGTLARVILKRPELEGAALRAAAARRQLALAARPGFNNSYALAVPQVLARRLGLTRISDLASHPGLRLGFSLEFLRREDGWPALSAHYELPQTPVGMEHALAYPALQAGQLDVTDAYTTDGELNRYAITLLADDRDFFPTYEALTLLDGRLDADTMRALNEQVSQDRATPRKVARGFLERAGLLPESGHSGDAGPGLWQRIAGYTLTHLKLTLSALSLACLLAVPLALAVSRLPRLARILVYLCGLLQTVPSLALLALLIPLMGLGAAPAVLALFLYSLLPIVRNTLTGIEAVDPLLKQVATGMGLTGLQRLRHVELPLAAPTILAGIKTAAIISIGTATLAAFVGAGGLGEPIITGLTLNDHPMILEGAIPAALLALGVEVLFEITERALYPAPLRRRTPD